jgi:bacteriocin biosynthesis cyclodehydratase domain-containing protein
MKEEVKHAGARAHRRPDADACGNPEGAVDGRRTSGEASELHAFPLVAGSFPRLKSSVSLFTANDGAVYLMRPSGEDLMIKSPPTGATMLLQSLDGTRSRDELAAELGARVDVEVDAALAQLWELDLLEDAAQDGAHGLAAEDVRRYDRQLAYLAELAPAGLHREALQARLAAAQVTIVGLGGVGCWTASALACTGVGRLVVVDGDTVELSNLNRQILYTPADVGQSKAHAGAEMLRAFNPSIEIVALDRRLDSEQAIIEVAEGSDVIAELADWPVDRISRWVARAAVALGVPSIQASQDPPILRVGPTFIPGETGCGHCQALSYRRRHPLYDELVAYRAARAQESPTFGPACAVIGGMLANEITNLLLGLAHPATAGRAAMVDLRTLEWSWEEPVVRDPACDICGPLPVA